MTLLIKNIFTIINEINTEINNKLNIFDKKTISNLIKEIFIFNLKQNLIEKIKNDVDNKNYSSDLIKAIHHDINANNVSEYNEILLDKKVNDFIDSVQLCKCYNDFIVSLFSNNDFVLCRDMTLDNYNEFMEANLNNTINYGECGKKLYNEIKIIDNKKKHINSILNLDINIFFDINDKKIYTKIMFLKKYYVFFKKNIYTKDNIFEKQVSNINELITTHNKNNQNNQIEIPLSLNYLNDHESLLYCEYETDFKTHMTYLLFIDNADIDILSKSLEKNNIMYKDVNHTLINHFILTIKNIRKYLNEEIFINEKKTILTCINNIFLNSRNNGNHDKDSKFVIECVYNYIVYNLNVLNKTSIKKIIDDISLLNDFSEIKCYLHEYFCLNNKNNIDEEYIKNLYHLLFSLYRYNMSHDENKFNTLKYFDVFFENNESDDDEIINQIDEENHSLIIACKKIDEVIEKNIQINFNKIKDIIKYRRLVEINNLSEFCMDIVNKSQSEKIIAYLNEKIIIYLKKK